MQRHMEPDEQIERKLRLFGPTTEDANEQRLNTLLQRFFDTESGQSGSGGAASGERERGRNVVSLGDTDRRRERWWSTTSIAVATRSSRARH